MVRTIEFYFDFMSPYAYLAHTRLPSLAARHGYSLEYYPIDLQEAKLAVGNTGPSTRDMPIKHRYMRLDLERWARTYRVPLTPPAGYGSKRINSITYYAIDRGCARKYVDVTWGLVWGLGRSMNDEGLLREVAGFMEWDFEDLLSFEKNNMVSERLGSSNKKALSRGVFGVPTMLIGDEMWWGNDRLAFLEDYLRENAT